MSLLFNLILRFLMVIYRFTITVVTIKTRRKANDRVVIIKVLFFFEVILEFVLAKLKSFDLLVISFSAVSGLLPESHFHQALTLFDIHRSDLLLHPFV